MVRAWGCFQLNGGGSRGDDLTLQQPYASYVTAETRTPYYPNSAAC